MDPTVSRLSLSGFDVVSLAFSGLGMLWAAGAVLRLQPLFLQIFSELGGPIPALTRLCLEPWFPFALGLVPLLVVAEGVLRNGSRGGRAFRMGLAIFLTLALPALFLVGMYLPIFAVAGAIE